MSRTIYNDKFFEIHNTMNHSNMTRKQMARFLKVSLPTIDAWKKRFKDDSPKPKRGLSQLMVAVSLKLKSQRDKIETETVYTRDVARFNIILEEVSNSMNISEELIKASGRKKFPVIARSITIFITRYTTILTLDEMGKRISSSRPKDHSTIIHACNRFMNLYEAQDEAFEEAYEPIKELLHSKHGITVDFNDVLHQPLWFQKMMAERNS